MLPQTRLSRTRSSRVLREMVRETRLDTADLIQPVFVHYQDGWRKEIGSMPGQYQLGVDQAAVWVEQLWTAGVRAVILFGIPEVKDDWGTNSWDDENGVIQRALRAMRTATPEMLLITDVCFCEYTSHGHCGVMIERGGQMVLDHETTCENLVKQAVSHVRAGADMVAPSGMIDGMVAAIRGGLDRKGMKQIPIMSYAVKYASAFYGPFRDAAQGAPSYGDRRTHQMDPANSNEALREAREDIEQGADIIMVKPALAYMDIIRRVKDTFGVPTAAYHVSGEYAMIKAAAQRGWLDERAVTMEILAGLKRAGTDLIITYHAADVVEWLKEMQ